MVKEEAIKNSFLRIKKEIEELKQNSEINNNEINRLKTEIYDERFIEKIADLITEKIEKKINNNPKINNNEEIEINNYQNEEIKNINNNIQPLNFIKNKVKSKIVELCKNRINSGNLKRLVVDKSKICSKASFYRYLSELKRENIIQNIEINNDSFLIATEAIINRNIYK